MPAAPKWRRYLRFWRHDVEADVDDELRFHFDERVADLVARGQSPGAARDQALAEFGDVDAVRAGLRAIGERRLRRQRWRDRAASAWHDVAYAARSLARARGLTATVVLTLALGLGANGAVFSLVDRLFFRPPAGVADPSGLRRLYVTQLGRTEDGKPFTRDVVTYPELLDLRRGAGASLPLVPYFTDDAKLRTGDARRAAGAAADEAPIVPTVFAGAGYFRLLGVRPALGRFFGGDEDRVDVAAPVVVLSDALWRREFGGDRAVLGRTLSVGRDRLTIVGVAPPGFAGVDLDAVGLWRPLGAFPGGQFGVREWQQSRMLYMFRVLTRPSPGADERDERQVAARATTTLRRGDPGDGFIDTTAVVSFGPIVGARGPGRRPQEVSIATRLAGVALAVLLIACANVANLLLARAVRRRREIAVRLALGVRAGRLRAMLLAEGVLLALAGGAAALGVSAWGGAALRRWLLPNVHWDGGGVDLRVAGVVCAAALATGLLAALAPALRASRPDLQRALKAGAREGTFQRSRLRTALVVVQAALSVVLLVGAGLFVRSLRNVEALRIGYDVDRLVFASALFDDADDPDARRRRVEQTAGALPALAARLARVPGVERVALATMAPMYGISFLDLSLPGRDSMPRSLGTPTYLGVSPEFFAAAGLTVVRGRAFADADRPGAPPVMVVNETMAGALWPGREALGQCVHFKARPGACYTVVGVVRNARRDRVVDEPPTMQYFLPAAQLPDARMRATTLVLRADPARAAAVTAAARRELRAALPGAEPRIRTMAEILAPQLRPWRLGAALFSVLGGLALAVAAVGMYSVLAYTVGQRAREFAVRVALGARAADVLRLVLGEGVRTAAAGVAAGVGLALAAGRLVASLLYGVSPRDLVVLAAVVALLLAVTLVACLLPAWRATRTAPVIVLRDE